jgi:hypothetical protein
MRCDAMRCDMPNGCAEASNGVLGWLSVLWSSDPGLELPSRVLPGAVPVQLVWASFVARSWFCS